MCLKSRYLVNMACPNSRSKVLGTDHVSCFLSTTLCCCLQQEAPNRPCLGSLRSSSFHLASLWTGSILTIPSLLYWQSLPAENTAWSTCGGTTASCFTQRSGALLVDTTKGSAIFWLRNRVLSTSESQTSAL